MPESGATPLTPDLRTRYDALWDAAAPQVRAGRVALDPWVLRQEEDARRGVTLLARPAPAVAAALTALTDALHELEPAQYYQPLTDLHLTVLAPFTATTDHEPYLARLEAYRTAVADALDGVPPFEVDVVGVTLTPAAVLAQGFPRDGALACLRDRLRAVLTARGLGGSLDERYRLETAHLTLVRFAAPLADPGRFVGALAAERGRVFGATRVTRLELTWAGWYQSAESSRPLGAYALAGLGRRTAACCDRVGS